MEYAEDMAEVFNNYFASVGSKLAAKIQGAMSPIVRSNSDSLVLHLTTANEVGKIINLKESAAGLDDIGAKILKSVGSL